MMDKMTDKMAHERETLVSAPQLAPFCERSRCRCRQCGMGLNRFDQFKMWLSSSAMAIVSTRYCAGGKAPTEQVGGMEAIIRGQEERFNPCAGVTQPHLHIGCKACGFEWLMQVRDAGR